VFEDASRVCNQSLRSVFFSPTVFEDRVVLHRSAQLIDNTALLTLQWIYLDILRASFRHWPRLYHIRRFHGRCGKVILVRVRAGYFPVLSAPPRLLCCTGTRLRSWANDLFTREIVWRILTVPESRSRKTVHNVQQATLSAYGQALFVSDVL
jgi:hypothetical protein